MKLTRTQIDEKLDSLTTIKEKVCWLVDTYPDNFIMMLKCRKLLISQIDKAVPTLQDSCYTLLTKCYWILNDIYDFSDKRVCCQNPYCQMPFIEKNAVNIRYGYASKHCSKQCQYHNVNTSKKAKATKLLKYGNPNYVNAEKANATKVAKYGTASRNNATAKATKLRKYGNPNFVNPEKAKATNQARYNVDNVFQLQSVKEKSAATKLRNHGNAKFVNPDKATTTCLQRYGKKRYTQTADYRIKSVNTSLQKYGKTNPAKADSVKEKTQKTNVIKYGERFVSQCKEIQCKQKQKYCYHDIKFDSAPELAYYIWLSDHNKQFQYNDVPKLCYDFDGHTYSYFPDFLVEGQLVEIKGDQFFDDNGNMFCPFRKKGQSQLQYEWLCRKFEAKHQCMLQNNVKILKSADYQQYLDYVGEKYGRDYLKTFRKPSKNQV